MRTLAVAVLCGALGCNPKPTLILGGTLVVGGALAEIGPDGCTQGKLCLISNQDLGGAMIVVGLVVLGIAVLDLAVKSTEPRPTRPVHAPPAPFPVTDTDPTHYETEPQPRAPAPNEPPLPAAGLAYSDATQRQFALQASSAARRGNCPAAVASGKQLSIELEQQLLAADPAYARCVAGH